MLVKYEIYRAKQNEPNSSVVLIGIEDKAVSKKEYKKLLNEGWFFRRKKYFIITYLFDSWSELNKDQKIKIIGIITASIISIIGFIYFKN